MRIEDGNTSNYISVNTTEFDDFYGIDKAEKASAGGKIKTQTGGKRFLVDEKFFVTMAQWGTFSSMLSDGNAILFYTPTTTPEYMDDLQFPIEVTIGEPDKEGRTIDGERRFIIKIKIKSVDYV